MGFRCRWSGPSRGAAAARSGAAPRGLPFGWRTALLTAMAAGIVSCSAGPQKPAATARPTTTRHITAAPRPAAPAAVTTPLQSAWQSVLAEPGIRHALIGGFAYDVTTGKTLASIHAGWRLTPGSVTKLYPTAASLADWGSRFGLVTRVAQAQAGGPVYLVGGGDLFSAPLTQPGGNAALAGIAKAVAARVHSASRVVGVSALFSGWASGPAWDLSEVGVIGDPAVSALSADRGDLLVTVTPGAGAGSSPTVAVDPGDPALVPPGLFQVENDAVTGPAGTHSTLFIHCVPGTDTIVITGTEPLGSAPVTGYLAVGNPARYTAALFQHYLAADGVRLARPATTGTLPGGAHEIYTYRSPKSLSSYIRTQNSWSVNQMAENLYRLLGVARHGPGSPQAAQAAVDTYLAQAHLSRDRVQVDGSGLSVLDEMSAAQITGMLTYVAHQRYFSTFEHSLIHIGRTSQCTFMCGFMDHTAADGHVWVKTGSLANQWNYAGYAHARNGDLIAFTLLFDGLQASNSFDEAIGPIDKMTVDVARWPDEPHARAAAPAAAQSTGLPPSVTALLPPGVAGAARSGSAPGTVVAASVVNVATGKVVAQVNGQTELQAGLLGRLATVAAALRRSSRLNLAGPEVTATGPVTGSRVDGNLVLAGRDDPMISRQQLAALARSLASRGIRSVAGRLEYVAGGSAPFGNQAYGISDLPFSTPYEAAGSAYSPPAGPLIAGQGKIGIVLRGAARPGQPAVVTVEPAGSPVRVTGTVHTVGSAQQGPTAVWQPGAGAYQLSGSVAAGQRTTLVVAPPYPALLAADWFLAALRAAGITVRRAPVPIATGPGSHRLASQPPPSLAAEAAQAMTDPSNVAPFGMYAQLGQHARADIAALTGSFDQVVDPSGNAFDDFLTARSISGMLAAIHSDPAEAPLTGLLRQPWIVRQPEHTTMTGYTTGPGGEPLAYTVIINGQLYNPVPDLPSRYEPQISH